MTTSSLSARLTTLSDSNKAILQLVHRLSKLNFQPGSLPLNSDEGDVRVELSAEIHENLKQLEEELELIKQEVEELTAGAASSARRRDGERDRERSRLTVQVARLGEDLKQSRAQFRKAQLRAKRNAELAKQKERELLFAGVQSGSDTPSSSTGRRRGQDKLSADEVLVNASSDVTAALRRTHQLMQSELSRSRFAQETLEQSTAALADLGEHYTDLNTLLANSRSLLSSLVKSQKSDTWYLETAFYILVTTIIWLVFRRFLYGPLWWFVWLPLKLGYRVLFAAFAAVGITGGVKSVSGQGTSLIVKPSATGKPPPLNIMSGQQPPAIRVGGGGHGAKHDPSQEGSLSQQVGQMAEESQGQQQQHQGEEAKKQQVVRGDGQPLVDSDKPRNPKKRMWDENVERAKYEEAEARKRDEL